MGNTQRQPGIQHSFAFNDVRVAGRTLHPEQQPSGREIRQRADFHEQRMIKFAERACFHSLQELFHASLLESDPEVPYYVPQPFKLWIKGEPYIPDIYFVRQGRRYVGELKPEENGFPDEKRIPLEAFFNFHRMTFIVITNESVMEREVEAQNWLKVVRHLLDAEYLDTAKAEWDIYEEITRTGQKYLIDYVDPGDRESSEIREAAVYRLLHAGKIETDMTTRFIGFDSELRPCI